MATMKAAFLCGAGKLEVREIGLPIPGEGQVLVKTASVGVCGSDVHYFIHGRIGPFVADRPLILGHESAGTVVAVGKGVTLHKEGDRVALEPGVPCGKCELCRRGRYNLCAGVTFMASAPAEHGSLAEYMAYDQHFAYRLPSEVSFDEGALAEPLSVAVYVMRRSGLALGKSVAILGAGPVGLLMAQVARASGASAVYITDIYDNRLALAGKFGATEVIRADRADPVARIMQLTGDRGVDVAIEAAGTLPTTQQAVDVAARGATVVLVGWVAEGIFPLNLGQLGVKELDLKGVFRYANAYPEAIGLLGRRQVDVAPLITHHFQLADVAEAFRVASEGKQNSIKIMINM